MYVLYQPAIIEEYCLFFPRLKKKLKKVGEPSVSLGGHKVEPFFLTFFLWKTLDWKKKGGQYCGRTKKFFWRDSIFSCNS